MQRSTKYTLGIIPSRKSRSFCSEQRTGIFRKGYLHGYHPFRFGDIGSKAIAKEDTDHSYHVVKVEGTDLTRLLSAHDSQHRLDILQNIVKEAHGAGGSKDWA